MSSESILIVEDNEILREGLKVLLEAEGYQVINAGHGEEALELMTRLPPDLILSDIAMPVMDGYEFFDRVREHAEWVSIPFVFLTARRAREDVFAGKMLGVEDYLIKPVARQELVSTIRSRLARSQQLLFAQIQQSYDEILMVLANVIEQRDTETRKHVENVTLYAKVIARQLGWTSVRLNQLHYGSILHDVGKIRIREDILKKPGPLNEEEWAEMKKHPIRGAEMIRNIPYLAGALPVIRHHHERWDGRGYPDGLAGEAIPIEARIVTVADSLDAMLNRPYRVPFTLEQGYQEIVRCNGTQFDPAVVNAFQRAWDEIQLALTR